MIRSFDDIETASICKGNKSKKLPMTIQNVARRKLRMIEAAKVVEDLRIPPLMKNYPMFIQEKFLKKIF